jgi:hypothetical protein
MLGGMNGHTEKGKRERDRQGGMQKAAEIFVEFEECHCLVPLFTELRGSAKDQIK